MRRREEGQCGRVGRMERVEWGMRKRRMNSNEESYRIGRQREEGKG